jgi:hypothetical protein
MIATSLRHPSTTFPQTVVFFLSHPLLFRIESMSHVCRSSQKLFHQPVKLAKFFSQVVEPEPPFAATGLSEFSILENHASMLSRVYSAFFPVTFANVATRCSQPTISDAISKFLADVSLRWSNVYSTWRRSQGPQSRSGACDHHR